MGLSTDTYPYGEEFQDRLIALMLREKSFLHRYAQTIDPEFFDNVHCRELSRLVLDYYFEKHRYPSPARVKTLIHDAFPTDKEKRMRRDLLRLVSSTRDADLSDADQIAEVVVEFAGVRKMEAVVRKLADDISRGEKVSSMWEQLDRARNNLTIGGQADEMDLSASFMEAPSIISKSGLYNSTLKIPTMIPTLDEALHGGLGRGELGMVVADTGRGKSTYLVNMGAAALMQHLPVYHILVTELVNIDMLLRYTARLTGVACDDIANERNVDEYNKAMAEVISTYSPHLRSRRVPPGTTVSTVRSLVSRYVHINGHAPALLLIDDTDDLVSRHHASDGYDELGHVYAELKDLAHDFDMAIWADSQTNRSAGTTANIKLQHVGDSYKKPRKADVVVTLNQNDDELEQELMRINIVKARRARRKKGEIWCKADLARMLVMETEPPAEESIKIRRSKPEVNEAREAREKSEKPSKKHGLNGHGVNGNGAHHHSSSKRDRMNGASAHA